MRVKWNRQLDGSLTRRQAEEEAAQQTKEKDKVRAEGKKSSPKLFRLFRRKKRHRRPDDETDRSPEVSFATPSEADDEDCASISSVATVASQPVTEVCHRDRTMSLFSSFRLNFPGGKKKSKRGTLPPSMPLFLEKEPENNRYSTPDLMRVKLDPAHPQTELSKSSPSVRNDPVSSTIPGDFQSLSELRTENSASFQQLKHANTKGAQEDTKLAKSVSFSDCQESLSSKQVSCANARYFQTTTNGPTERKAKPSKRKCPSHSTDERTVCENQSPSDGADSLRLPNQPSISNHSADSSKEKSQGTMSGIVSPNSRRIQSCDEVCKDRPGVSDVREKWFNDIRGRDQNGNVLERNANVPKLNYTNDNPAVMLNVKSCNGPIYPDDLCAVQTIGKSNAMDGIIQVSTKISSTRDTKIPLHLDSNNCVQVHDSHNSKCSVRSHVVDKLFDYVEKNDKRPFTKLPISVEAVDVESSSNTNVCSINSSYNDHVYTINYSNSIDVAAVINSADSNVHTIHNLADIGLDPIYNSTSTMDVPHNEILKNNTVHFGEGVRPEVLKVNDSVCLSGSLSCLDEKRLTNDYPNVCTAKISDVKCAEGDFCQSDINSDLQELEDLSRDLHNSFLELINKTDRGVIKKGDFNESASLDFEKYKSENIINHHDLNSPEIGKYSSLTDVFQWPDSCIENDIRSAESNFDVVSENSCSSLSLPSINKELDLKNISDTSLHSPPCDNPYGLSTSKTLLNNPLPSFTEDDDVKSDDISSDAAMLNENNFVSSHFLANLKSNFNDDIIRLNLLNSIHDDSDFLYALCSSCSRYRKTSVLNLNSPSLHLNNSDVEGYLHKLTNVDEVIDSNRFTKGVNIWNASFVQKRISNCEFSPTKQEGLSSHVSVEDPTPYATGRGKLGSEDRCPDAFPSMGPSGSSSSNIVTLRESDLHRGGIDTPQYSAESRVENRGGSEMLSNVGSSVGFGGKSCDSTSLHVYDKIGENYPEIYDHPCYPDVCGNGHISPEISVSTISDESYNSFSVEKLSGDIVLFNESCVLESPELPQEVNEESTMVNECDKSPMDEIIHQEVCNDCTTDSVKIISNGYHSEIQNDIPNGLDVTYLLPSESEGLVESMDTSNIQTNVVEMCFQGDKTETDDIICDGVKEKIKLFESGSADTSAERITNKNSVEEGSVSQRRKSFEKSKSSMIPSLRKNCLNIAIEKQSRSPKQAVKNLKGPLQSNSDDHSTKTKLENVNGFHNASVSDQNYSSCINGDNLSLESDYKCPNEFSAESEQLKEPVHFTSEISNVSCELVERCKSEELLSSLRRFGTDTRQPKVQECHSNLPNRRHSSTEANFCKNGKVCKIAPTANLASSVDLIIKDDTSEFSYTIPSSVNLDEVRGVQGQLERGLQSRCASLPLVIGQVRATSPLNNARRNYPIKDGSRGKSRIPRKPSGVRSLHSKPVRPPMWLSKAELSQEIQRLSNLCEIRTKELNRLKMETKHVSVGFDAFASLFKYMVEDLNALSVPTLSEDLKKTLKQLELAKQDLAYYEREVEEMKAHHCQELNDLSNKLFEVFHGEVTELSSKHQEEMNRLQNDHQKQIETLTTTFNATSQEALAEHEAMVSKLKQELINQREELQLFQEREIKDLEQKHTQSSKMLQEHIEQLQRKCAELQQHSMGMEDAMRKDTDTKLQWVTSRKVDLEKEVESLKAVLEMKNKELHTIRVQNLEMEKQLEELPLAREKIKMLQARAEDLEALMAEKTKVERRLSTENQQIRDTYEKESKVNKRLSMENEELQWRIRQAEQSLLSGSFQDVLEYPEDVENGSVSPAKSPAPQSMSRSVFFTYIDKEGQASSPRTQYKKITPGFSANYKTSPGKSSKSPSISSPRRPKSQSEPPQPPTLSSGTPRKVSKQNSLKQKNPQKRQRSGSDCGKPTGDPQAEVAFLSIAGSMTSSVSSESSVFGERLLEEHKEQILESLEILREQRSIEGEWSSEDNTKVNDESPQNLESEDMSRSSEFSDPKTYYHMTFPVMKEAGMPDCDMSAAAAQAIHSTAEGSSPVDIQTQPENNSASQHPVVKGEQEASIVKAAHSVNNLPELEPGMKEKSKEQDRWRTI